MESTEAKTESVPAGKPRILLVEDSPLNQQITLKQLEALGYCADLAGNGVEALAALERASYPIVLMDCQMPEMDGYETTWQIRNREKEQAQGTRSKIYIITLTANTKPEDRERCLSSGMDDYVSKPVQLVELEVALQRAGVDPSRAQAPVDVIDPIIMASLRQLRKGNQPDPVSELISLFLRDAPPQILAINQAILERNMSATLGAASSLKGNAANLGARRLASLCAELEEQARAGTLEEAAPILERAKDEFTRVQFALERERKS
jgi:CheY-like chemotaxis protein/HPt (histidine-containing phosphotransfer) domain-containing protein